VRLSFLIVAFILGLATPYVFASPYAYINNPIGGKTVLTDDVCRYDKTMPEAYTIDSKGKKLYACYWFGIKNVYFKTDENLIRALPKRSFILYEDLI